MSFSISLMRNNSDRNVVNKNVNNIMTVNGTLKDSTSIINPVIRIQCNLSSVTGCNYIYIPEFDRYYYVNDITSISNDIVEFSCHVDVLYTYSSQIRSNTAIVRRQENQWNLYLNDGTFRVYQDPKVVTKAFPSGFNTQEFVLAVAGS